MAAPRACAPYDVPRDRAQAIAEGLTVVASTAGRAKVLPRGQSAVLSAAS